MEEQLLVTQQPLARKLAFAGLLAGLAIVGLLRRPSGLRPVVAAELFTPQELAWLSAPTGPPPAGLSQPGCVWVRAYRRGRLQLSRWWEEGTPEQALRLLAESAPADADTWWELGQGLQRVSARRAGPERTGLLGYAVDTDDGRVHVAPQDLVRGGLTPQDMQTRLRLSHSLQRSTICTARVALLHSGEPARQLARTNPLVAPSEVSRATAERFTRGLADFLVRGSVREGGVVPYQINPPDGVLSEDKMLFVRLYLGCWSLVRWSRQHPEAEPVARRLCEMLVSRFGKRDGRWSWMENGSDRGLGSLAFMVLALDALPHPDAWSRSEADRMLDTLLQQQQPRGWFRTQYSREPLHRNVPSRRDLNQNFYAPEAMLCLAQRYARSHDPRCAEAFDRAFAFYTAWFPRHRSPAFVPWFVQACAVMTRAGREGYSTKALELQDWHLDNLQPYAQVPLPDLRGGLISERTKFYGKISYASSCGVHMEGLIEGWWLADHERDPVRKERYRAALMESLRYMMQLQFRGPADSYWLTPAAALRFEGGIRSTPNTCEIQVDNVAHTLNAMINVLSRLPASDFHAP